MDRDRREFLLNMFKLGVAITCFFLYFSLCFSFRSKDVLFADAALSGEESLTPSASSCATTQDYNDSTSNEGNRYFGLSGWEYMAFKFTAQASYTACEHDINIRAASGKTPTFTYTVQYRQNDDQGDGLGENDRPSTNVGSASNSLDTTGYGESYAVRTLDWTSGDPSLTSGTTYWYVYQASTSTTQWCELLVSQSPTNGSLAHILRSSDGSTWTQVNATETAEWENRSE